MEEVLAVRVQFFLCALLQALQETPAAALQANEVRRRIIRLGWCCCGVPPEQQGSSG